MKRIIIAIDGFSSSGKSTMARRLATAIGYRYIDSGAMYRAVTLYALRNGIATTGSGELDIEALSNALPEIHIDFRPMAETQHTLLNGEDVESEIRSMEVSQMVSPVAAVPAVRHALTAMQRQYGKERGIVMDGRDIGTTVFPDAEMKIFVNPPAETRARRRYLELAEKGMGTPFETVLENVLERDKIDSTRKESPLRKASDAIELDNGNMTLEEQDQWMLSQYKSIIDECNG
ncbi:MAG: (d)CMP kinase [Pseudoflavonifractor sp.]|nr:(d)CMP kinase [Alloprevotella sp.]MCM1117046.1 (d)CMP kinase [Pseudoflavonifractor sp.]